MHFLVHLGSNHTIPWYWCLLLSDQIPFRMIPLYKLFHTYLEEQFQAPHEEENVNESHERERSFLIHWTPFLFTSTYKIPFDQMIFFPGPSSLPKESPPERIKCIHRQLSESIPAYHTIQCQHGPQWHHCKCVLSSTCQEEKFPPWQAAQTHVPPTLMCTYVLLLSWDNMLTCFLRNMLHLYSKFK